MKRLFVLLCALAALVTLRQPPARADSHHQLVKVSRIVDKATKRTVGAKLRVVLQPQGHAMVRMGLLPSRAELPAVGFTLKTEIMKPTSGRWLHNFPDQSGLGKAPREVDLVVHYDDKVKGGQKYQLGSVWNNDPKATSGLHVWGVEWTPGWGDPEIELPR
jgi:hypothetical protein